MRDLVAVHGGIDMPSDAATFRVLEAAAMAGWLERSDAVAGVVAAVEELESSPLFNAGYGSVLTRGGNVEVDAAIVDGSRARIAAVAAVPELRHPIRVAAALLEAGLAALLVGDGARAFATSVGEPTEDLRTDAQILALRDALAGVDINAFTGIAQTPRTETVGAIAHFAGSVVAGTSTGGLIGKPSGRVGDSAIFGAGHWADERVAVLCSGEGEALIRARSASECAARILAGAPVRDAVAWAVLQLELQTGARGAILATDCLTGEIAAAHNGMDFPVVCFDGDAMSIVIPSPLVGVSS